MEGRTISKQAFRSALRYYLSQYRRYAGAAAVAFILPGLGMILTFFVPPIILARVVDQFVTAGSVSVASALESVALFAASWLAGESLWRIAAYFNTRLKANSLRDLHRIAFRRLMGKDYAFYTDNFVGTLSSRTQAFTSGFVSFTDVLHYSLIGNTFTIIFATVVLWKYSPYLPLVLLLCIAVMLVVVVPLVRTRTDIVAKRQEEASKVSGQLSDALTNVAAIKAYAAEGREYATLDEHASAYAEAFRHADNYHNLRIETRISPLYVLTNALGFMASIVLVSRLGLQPSVLIIVFSYYLQVTNVFWQINYIYRNIESAITGAAEFTRMFDEAPAIEDVPDAPRLSVSAGAISLERVRFGYGTAAEGSFLDGFNLAVRAGERVGLVGPSGGGKTTITKLLLRFIDVQEGSITIDGQDVKAVSQQSLREAIAYVPQEPLLFHRSLFDNIAYGKPGATKEEVEAVAKLAHAHEFIDTLPKGYDTMVGERGIKLSGGQRQRVAIARAMLKDSKILVLDEATSALDSESEKYIQKGLWELMKGKTAVVIAHRLSTIKHLDRIIVLDRGRIVQDGPHEELLKEKDGLYAQLWSHQSGGFIEE